MEEFYNRVIAEVKEIIDKNTGKNICIVTHGTVIRAILCRFYGKTLEYMANIYWHDNTSVTIVDYDNEKDEFEVLMEGNTEHLDFELSTVQNQEWWQSYVEEQKKKNKLQ
jgi:probable phosphoglycerate mutase